MSHCDKAWVSTKRLDFCFVLGSFCGVGHQLLQTGGMLTWFFYLVVQTWNVLVGQSIFSLPSKTDTFSLAHPVGFNISMIVSHGCRCSKMRQVPKQTDISACLQGVTFLVLFFCSKWLCIVGIVRSFLFRTGQSRAEQQKKKYPGHRCDVTKWKKWNNHKK